MSIFFYILLFATSIQVFYFLFFYSRILLKSTIGEQTGNSEFPPVSVIVCAHNERENLEQLIPLVLRQEYLCFELIIADDRSADGSYEYFKDKYRDHPGFRIIRIGENLEGKNFKKYALTKAISETQYDVILLTDADCLPASGNWVKAMASKLSNGKEIVLGYSPYAFVRGWLNFLIRYETLYTAIQYFSFALAGLPYMGVGRNLLYKKSLFENNEGFNSHFTTLGGDDDLFVREVATRKNVAICFEKEAHMISMPKENYFEWFRQKRRHLSVGTQYKMSHKLLLGVQILSHILFYLGLVAVFLTNYKYALIFLMIRSLVFMVIFALIARKLEDNYKYWWLLLPLDVVYIFNYLLITLSLLLYKKIKWS